MKLEDIPDEECAWCGERFEGKRYDQRFCCKDCKNAFHDRVRNSERADALRKARAGYVCPGCGATFDAKHLASQIYCSKLCKTREMLRRYEARIGTEEFKRRRREWSRRSKAKARLRRAQARIAPPQSSTNK